MPYELVDDAYGKAQNRLMRVVRETPRHEIRDITVSVRLRGDFEAVYLEGDNAGIPATDTMKNTVFALGRTEFSTGSIEEFGKALIRHWVQSDRVASAEITLTEHPWVRLGDHHFHRGSSGDHRAWVSGDGETFTVKAGLGDLFVLRSTGSGFSGFERDRVHVAARDRRPHPRHRRQRGVALRRAMSRTTRSAWQAARDAMVGGFADHYSESVQQTIHRMATAAMDAVPEIGRGHDRAAQQAPQPRRPRRPSGIENPNEVFIATQDPFGLITGTVRRV